MAQIEAANGVQLIRANGTIQKVHANVTRADELADCNYPAITSVAPQAAMYVPLVGAAGQPNGSNIGGALVSDNGFNRSHPHSHLLMPQHSTQWLARNSLAVSGAVGPQNPSVPVGLSMQRR